MAGAQRGFLLLTAVVLIVVVALLLTVMVYFSATGSQASVRHLSSKQALFIAGTGLERGIRALESPVLTERLYCNAVTGNVNLTNVAFGDGRFTVTGGASLYSNTAVTLNGNVNATVAAIPLNSVFPVPGYATSGRVMIDREKINYSEISNDAAECGTPPCLLGAQRGVDGTAAAAHAGGTPVGQYQCDLQSQGGVPDLVSARGLRVLRQAVQLQEGWIAGNRNGNSLTFLHWNRPVETQWSNASFADATNRENLNDISILSYVDGWAVGDRRGNNFTLFHLSAGGWTAQPLTDNTNREDLNSAFCAGSDDCWAVGDRNGNNFTFVRRNAGAWTAQPLTDAANRENLNAVHCVSTDNCWAVGDRKGNNFTFVRRNAGAWTAQPLTDNTNREDLNAVFCAGSDDCWAVGRSRGNNFTFVRRNAGAWTAQPLTDPANRQHLNGIYCVATDDCWAVGNGGVIVRMTPGPVWAVFKTPGQVTGVNLNDVACATANDCWAVGEAGVILHWDGSDWTIVASPTGQNLNAIDLVAARRDPQAAWHEIYQ